LGKNEQNCYIFSNLHPFLIIIFIIEPFKFRWFEQRPVIRKEFDYKVKKQ